MLTVRPSWRDRLRTAPLWVLFIYYAVGFGVLGLLVPGHTSSSIGGAVFAGVLFATLMTAVTAVWRRRDRARAGAHPAKDRALLERALRTGEPPADPALDASLLALIKRRREQLVWAQRASPIVFGFLTLLSVGIAITDALFAVYAAVFVGFIVFGQRSIKRSRQRFVSLERAVAARSGMMG